MTWRGHQYAELVAAKAASRSPGAMALHAGGHLLQIEIANLVAVTSLTLLKSSRSM